MTPRGKHSRPRPVVLCVLDGWGLRAETAANAIAQAPTPVWDRLAARASTSRLHTSGLEVGLPEGQMGNSEVGHMNLGAGRVVLQDLPRIDAAIASGALDADPRLADLAATATAAGGVVHIMGLASPGGVHSHQDHIVALARILSAAGLGVRVHGFLDGRDVPPKSAGPFIAALEAELAALPDARLASLSGRYFAMDRDQRWDRVAKAYGAIANAEGPRFETAAAALEAAYGRGESDEFITPGPLGDYRGVAPGDALIMANFRADRAIEILSAFVDPGFERFARRPEPALSGVLGMVEYSSELSARVPALFPAIDVSDSLGEIVAGHGLRQLRIAETEKYKHVTSFFNGGREDPFEGETRALIPSPKVATYDLKPEMSAHEVTDRLIAEIEAGVHDLIVVNYANPDMVGHTGIMAAALKAVETVDACLGRLVAAVEAAGGAMLVTADHGNIEMMVEPETGAPHTAHTTGPVPIALVGGPAHARLAEGRLADVAPTLLALMGLGQPAAMSGRNLLTEEAGDGHGPTRHASAA